MSQAIKYLSKLIKKDLDKHRFLNRVMENIAFGVIERGIISGGTGILRITLSHLLVES
jgi:hypothetical protein